VDLAQPQSTHVNSTAGTSGQSVSVDVDVAVESKPSAIAKAKAAALATFPARARAPAPPPITSTDIVAIPLHSHHASAPVTANPTPTIPPKPPPLPTDPVTPLQWQMFQQLLREHPDRDMVRALIQELQVGVRIGYKGPRDQFRPAPNLPILPEHDAFIDEEIAKEVRAGRRFGPYDQPPFPNLIVSPIGVVTKKLSSKLRMIHHLSWPRAASANSDSINEHIGTEDSETVLQSFDDAIHMLANIPLSQPAKAILLAKIDVKSAYRLVPVHADDHHCLGMMWRGKYYYDSVLVFGLASACQQWERVATAIHWIAEHHLKLKLLVHYIDDYLLISVGSKLAQLQLEALLKLFDMLGVPISLEKLEGPTTVIPFLGIQIDTCSMTVSLDPTRLLYVQSLLFDWMKMEKASIKELQSLTGTLSFCCKVIRAGRIFLRRLINFTTHLLHRHKAQSHVTPHPIADSVKKDIHWWLTIQRNIVHLSNAMV